jgi:hypothetical protein
MGRANHMQFIDGNKQNKNKLLDTQLHMQNCENMFSLAVVVGQVDKRSVPRVRIPDRLDLVNVCVGKAVRR